MGLKNKNIERVCVISLAIDKYFTKNYIVVLEGDYISGVFCFYCTRFTECYI